MAFDILKILKEKTDKFELEQEEIISKADAVNGLNDVLGIAVPEDVQGWMPDEIKLKKLKIDRTTQPKETYELEMEVNLPPVFDLFSNIQKIEAISFEVKTNQPLKNTEETTTTWGIAVTTLIFGNTITFKSSSENSKRFEMENFELNDEKLIAAFSDLEVTLPEEFFSILPDKIEIKKLVIDGSTPKPQLEIEVAMEMGELFEGKLDNWILVKPVNARLYIKKEADKQA